MWNKLQSSLPILALILNLGGLKYSVCGSYVHHVEVSMDGHDNSSCLTNVSFPCETLGYVLENLNNSTKVIIKDGHYSLNKNYNITHFENLYFTGQNSVKIQCSREVGLQFRFCDNVVFEQLMFEGCGRLEYSAPFNLNDSAPFNLNDSGLFYQFYSGVSLTYCRHLAIKNCTFSNSRGIGLVLYDVGGNVSVVDSHFINNTATEYSKSNFQRSGSGVLLHLTQFGSVYPFDDTKHHLYSNGNTYIFRGCTFTLNTYKVHNGSQRTPQPFGHGAGITVFLCETAKNNSLLIDLCHFHNNTAAWGGGVFSEFQNMAEGNTLKILDSEFIGNFAKFGGGAVRTGNDIHENKTFIPMENTVEHKKNKFVENNAELGGAVSHYGQTYPHVLGKDRNSIHFQNCSFFLNTALMGSAISVALNNKNNWIMLGPEIPYCVQITNCTIENNSVKEMGVVYSSKVPMILRGWNKFQSNSNTALLMDNAPLKVFDKATFISNIGIKGGAVGLYGQTRLILTKGSFLYFAHNGAHEKGGALYMRTPGPEVAPFNTRELRRHECSLGYEDEEGKMLTLEDLKHWDTHIEFVDNNASLQGGNSVYSTTLQSCFLANETTGQNSAFAWKNIFNYTGQLKDEISTDPVKISVKENEWFVAPGEVFNPTIVLLDEKDSPVHGIVKIEVSGSSSARLLPESLFLVQSQSSKSPSNTSVIHGLKLLGSKRSHFTLTISSVGGQTISKSIDQKFKNCYDGFEQTDQARTCLCMSDSTDMHEGVYNCSSDGKSVNLKTGYWGGQIKGGKFVTYPCPQHYCQFNEKQYFFRYDKSKICAGNRSSNATLCGKCKENFTVSLGSENCVKISNCKNFKISWGIPIFIVITPLVIVILLCINVDIFTSYLNSWLFFYQVLPFVLKVETQLKLDEGMKGILDLVSWKLPGVKLSCFVKSLTNIGKLALNYMLPVYMLAILIIIALLARCCSNCYQKTNVFRAMSSILVLCYTNLTMISFNVVHWVKFQKDFSVLFVEGSITNKNIPSGYYVLLVFSILVIICFVIVFPLMLLCRGFFIRNCRFMTYFTPLYNIFQHCFRDNLGSFSAYYFICRIALLVLNAGLTTPGPYKRCLTEILVFLTLVIFVYVQPYKMDSHLKWLNTVDTVILSNLCLVAFMSSAQNTEASQKTIDGMQLCIEIFVWLPMLYLAGLIIIAIKQYYPRFIPSSYQNMEDPTSTSGTPSH